MSFFDCDVIVRVRVRSFLVCPARALCIRDPWLLSDDEAGREEVGSRCAPLPFGRDSAAWFMNLAECGAPPGFFGVKERGRKLGEK